MSLKKYSHEEISKLSMIELANIILTDKKKPMDFRDIFKKIAKLKEFTDEQKETNITQFYTDLNIDGGFMTTGLNLWGLKGWYLVEQRDEAITAAPKKKKPKKKVAKKKKDDYDDEEESDIVDEDIEEVVDESDDDDYDDDDDDEDYEEDDDEENEDKDKKKKKK